MFENILKTLRMPFLSDIIVGLRHYIMLGFSTKNRSSKESLFLLWLLMAGWDLAYSHWQTSVVQREGMVLTILACNGGE